MGLFSSINIAATGLTAERVRLDVISGNVDIVTEMVDMISASRAYEANASIIEGSKAMFQRALDIGRR